MTILLHARALGHMAGQRVLFDDIDVTIADGDRIGLVGHNGSGKSTLLGLLAGDQEPDRGEVIRRRGLRVGRVEQFLPSDVAALDVTRAVGSAPQARGAVVEDWQAQTILAALGFTPAQMILRAGDLSGGQQNRIMFARALIREPDVLLLDEPTNHLDLVTIRVFEDYLATLKISYLLVSHDRAFLDAVTDHTLFLRDGRIYRFELGYSAARLALEAADEAAQRSRASEDRKIDALRSSAKRMATWGRVYDNKKFARRAKNMERRVERMAQERTFVSRGAGLELDLELGSIRSNEALRVTQCNVCVESTELFAIPELLIRPGERVALLGGNGVGKSTFIRMLIEHQRELVQRSELRFSPQVALGYYDQELDEVAADVSLVEFVSRRGDSSEVTARGRLIAAGFPYEEHGKRVSDMSGGERARALFVVLALTRPNFLILDEPTNHLDVDGKEQLEAQLLDSAATLLVTAHDRRFLDTIAERFVCISDGVLIELNDPTQFYDSPDATRVARSPVGNAAPDRQRGISSDGSPGLPADTVLERIVELEDLLEQDQGRKPKFQKPERQATWQKELDGLYSRLDAAD